jgi:hypothetical protein
MSYVRDVRSLPVLGEDDTCRGWVRFDADRVGHANQTEFCITIDTTSYLSPVEARRFAERLREVADDADSLLLQGKA